MRNAIANLDLEQPFKDKFSHECVFRRSLRCAQHHDCQEAFHALGMQLEDLLTAAFCKQLVAVRIRTFSMRRQTQHWVMVVWAVLPRASSSDAERGGAASIDTGSDRVARTRWQLCHCLAGATAFAARLFRGPSQPKCVKGHKHRGYSYGMFKQEIQNGRQALALFVLSLAVQFRLGRSRCRTSGLGMGAHSRSLVRQQAQARVCCFIFRAKLWSEDITYPVRLYGEVVEGLDANGEWCLSLGKKS